MTLYLVRHGETDWNLENRIQGDSDIPLNQTGILQAREVKDKLKDISFDLCYNFRCYILMHFHYTKESDYYAYLSLPERQDKRGVTRPNFFNFIFFRSQTFKITWHQIRRRNWKRWNITLYY